MDWVNASKERVYQLNKMNELRFKAYESPTLYNEKTNKRHEFKILRREFGVSEFVFLYNSRLRLF